MLESVSEYQFQQESTKHLCPGFHCVPGRDTQIPVLLVSGQDIYVSTKELSSPLNFRKDVPVRQFSQFELVEDKKLDFWDCIN